MVRKAIDWSRRELAGLRKSTSESSRVSAEAELLRAGLRVLSTFAGKTDHSLH